MNETSPPNATSFPEAKVRKRHFSAIWLIPIVAALIAGYLGFRSFSEKGEVVTISFRTAEGLSVGQTAVKYKSVTLGTVENIALNEDRSGVIVRVRMMGKTEDLLTDHTRFWVEKPRLNTTSLSDIVSGTYIELDPGPPGGEHETAFDGLENQPALPATEPGTTYILAADRLGSVTDASPVYYRDMNVGTVLGYDIGNGFGPINVSVFVRAPYDKLVKPTTRFWNASGLSVKVGAGGVHVELQSLQSVLGGGVAFDTPVESIQAPQADSKAHFALYDDHKSAEAAAYGKRVPYVTYVQSSIKDLAAGSPVQIFGIQVGQVTDVKLSFDPATNEARVRVAFEIEPARAFGPSESDQNAGVMQKLVQNGMRVKMESSDLIAGQEVLSLGFVPMTGPAQITMEGDAMVLPGQSGGFDNLTGALSDVASKLDQIPFEEIGKNLDHLLASANQTVGGPEMHQAVHSLAMTLANAEDLSRDAKQNLTPALQRLPEISAQLQSAVAQANAFMASVNTGYGQDSDFQRSTKRVLDEANDAARSIRLLADYLERHPEALVEGKKPEKSKP